MRRFHPAGAAAAMVFGIGLVSTDHVEAGLWVIGISMVVLGVCISKSDSAKALCWAIGTIACALVLAYCAATNEITGTATYRTFKKGYRAQLVSELVTRTSSPAKFRSATNMLWVTSMFSLIVGAGAWKFREWMENCD